MKQPYKLAEHQQEIVDFIRARGEVLTAEIAEAIGRPKSNTFQMLETLYYHDVITRWKLDHWRWKWAVNE